jgi:PAS domain S-box-containing protein
MKDEWRAIFDAVDVPILVLGLDGTVVRANRAAQDAVGRHQPDVVGRRVEALGAAPPWRQVDDLLVHLRETEVATALLRDRASGGGWQIAARRYDAPDGERRATVVIRDLRGGPSQAPTGPADRLVALGALVAGVAHEVRDPLFGISATLDAFEARFGSGGDFSEYVHALRDELGRLKALMQDLLDYGNAGTVTLTPGALDEVLTQTVRHLTPTAEQARVRLRCHVAGPLAPVLMDGRRLGQALENLLRNAVQHAPPGSDVLVEAREGTADEAQTASDSPAFWRLALETSAAPAPEARWIVCCVADEGPGFRADDLPRVFEPFFTRRRGGTGLGLSIVERIVEVHGGYVAAANRPQGGALVTMRLPCVPS